MSVLRFTCFLGSAWIFGLPMVLVLALSGCGRDTSGAPVSGKTNFQSKRTHLAGTVACPKTGQVNPVEIFAALPDRTGSHLDGPQTTQLVKQELVAQVHKLNPGTLVLIHFISGVTYSNQETIIKEVIPLAPVEVNCQIKNRWDRDAVAICKDLEKQYKAQRACVDAAKARIIQRIWALNPSTAKTTDIRGGFILVEEILREYNQTAKTLWVASDLEDNVGLPLPKNMSGLKGAKVMFRTTLRGNPQRLRRNVQVWTTRLESWGATVETYPLGFPIPQQQTKDKQSVPSDQS